jgi:glyoxylase-like metal-dependent hydrolase (beta-lactamase superfamily II)
MKGRALALLAAALTLTLTPTLALTSPACGSGESRASGPGEGVPARPNQGANQGTNQGANQVANQGTNPNTTPEKTPSPARARARVASPAGGRGGLFTPWRANLTETEPPFEIQRLDADTWVIRQSLATSAAAPFLYLLFGTNRALLLDSGTGNAPLRPAIDAIMAQRGTPGLPLLVAHSHADPDHTGGDAELAARPDTQIIGHGPAAVAAAFGITSWPSGEGHIDLGNRRLTILATPGHEAAHIMLHDPAARLLLTGDMLYPGRLHVPITAFAIWRASIARVATYGRRHPLRALLGAHIDLRRTPGEAYPAAARRHPDEHALALPAATLLELHAAVTAMAGEPVRETHADFIIVPGWPG